MPNWYEVFDNEEVQGYARRQAARLTALAVGSVLLTLVLAALGLEGIVPAPLVGVLLALSWLIAVRVIATRMRRLRRLVWCIKLSEARVVGYDYTRRKAVLEWDEVRRAELAADGLLLVGPAGCVFHVSHRFPDFAVLSHRVVYYAEQNGVPIFIDGQPWQEIDVYRLFPFLADDTAREADG